MMEKHLNGLPKKMWLNFAMKGLMACIQLRKTKMGTYDVIKLSQLLNIKYKIKT